METHYVMQEGDVIWSKCRSASDQSCVLLVIAFHFTAARSFKQQKHKDSQTEQTNSSLSTAPLYIISSGKVKADLIFCLVLIKQLLHYLISHNQVKEEEWGLTNQYMSTKSFWTVDYKFSPQSFILVRNSKILFLMPY